jgi:hypothetical protein
MFTGHSAELRGVAYISFEGANKPVASIFRETKFGSGELLHPIFRVPMQHPTEANYHPQY